jgi:hypothetical protein
MDIENLFTKETTVKISVVTIDKKKLTKSILNQIKSSDPFDDFYNLKPGVKFIGYVRDEFNTVIFVKDDAIYRLDFEIYKDFRLIFRTSKSVGDLHSIYPSEAIAKLNNELNDEENSHLGQYKFRERNLNDVITDDIKEDIKQKQNFLTQISSEISKRQIFI